MESMRKHWQSIEDEEELDAFAISPLSAQNQGNYDLDLSRWQDDEECGQPFNLSEDEKEDMMAEYRMKIAYIFFKTFVFFEYQPME